MTRLLYDSTSASDIPLSAPMVAGYIDHPLYTWSAADWRRFPRAVKVRIATRASTNDGHVLDCETGDATPAQCPGWVRMRRAAGADPSVYMNFSTWPAVRQAFATQGVLPPHYWVAGYAWPPDPSIPAGAVAHQYIDPPGSGGHYDLSSVLDHWPGVDTQEIPTMGGCFKPGTHEYHWVAVNPDDSVEHFWQNQDSGVIFPAESLGGTATDTPTCSWSSDSAIFCVQVRGTDGAIWQRTWKGSWGVWQSTGAITKLLGGVGPAGPKGDPGPPGSLPPTATIGGTVSLS